MQMSQDQAGYRYYPDLSQEQANEVEQIQFDQARHESVRAHMEAPPTTHSVMMGRRLLIHLLQRIRLRHHMQWIPLTDRDVHSVLGLTLLASRIPSIRTTMYIHSVASRIDIFYLVICYLCRIYIFFCFTCRTPRIFDLSFRLCCIETVSYKLTISSKPPSTT